MLEFTIHPKFPEPYKLGDRLVYQVFAKGEVPNNGALVGQAVKIDGMMRFQSSDPCSSPVSCTCVWNARSVSAKFGPSMRSSR